MLWKAYADKKAKVSFLCLKESVSIYLMLGFWYWTYACALPLFNFQVETNSCCLQEEGTIFRWRIDTAGEEILWNCYSQSFPKLLQPCMKAQQSCASRWSQSCKDSRMQWSELSGHHWVCTESFTNGVTKTLSSVQMTCLYLSLSNTGNAVICILQKNCSDRSCNF